MPRKASRRSKSVAPAIALTIAGSDSSSGAGIQADLKTFTAHGVYGLTAVTGIVAERPKLVEKIDPADAKIVLSQIEVLLRAFPVAAIKTGLLFSGEIVSQVAQILRRRIGNGKGIPLVVDPVMVASTGDALLSDDAVEAYEKELFPLATLITPNLDEASRLLGEQICGLESMRSAGAKLSQKYQVSVLLKGGHLSGTEAVDLLFVEENIISVSAPFCRGISTHGTGCTYSAAITAGLANGLSLENAVRRAKKFITAAIVQHFRWETAKAGSVHALNHSPENWE
jgi:hydroxymethylpyrimidine/phosphomethylpyrimidine kinase